MANVLLLWSSVILPLHDGVGLRRAFVAAVLRLWRLLLLSYD